MCRRLKLKQILNMTFLDHRGKEVAKEIKDERNLTICIYLAQEAPKIYQLVVVSNSYYYEISK
jgi:hypothetical protein